MFERRTRPPHPCKRLGTVFPVREETATLSTTNGEFGPFYAVSRKASPAPMQRPQTWKENSTAQLVTVESSAAPAPWKKTLLPQASARFAGSADRLDEVTHRRCSSSRQPSGLTTGTSDEQRTHFLLYTTAHAPGVHGEQVGP